MVTKNIPRFNRKYYTNVFYAGPIPAGIEYISSFFSGIFAVNHFYWQETVYKTNMSSPTDYRQLIEEKEFGLHIARQKPVRIR